MLGDTNFGEIVSTIFEQRLMIKYDKSIRNAAEISFFFFYSLKTTSELNYSKAQKRHYLSCACV